MMKRDCRKCFEAVMIPGERVRCRRGKWRSRSGVEQKPELQEFNEFPGIMANECRQYNPHSHDLYQYMDPDVFDSDPSEILDGLGK